MYRSSYVSLLALGSLMSMAVMAPAGDGSDSGMTIKDAVAALKPKNDKDWLANGAPSLDRIRVLMKNSDVTQEELDKAADGLMRPDDKSNKSPSKALADHAAKRTAASKETVDALVDPDTGRFNLIGEDGKRLKVFVKNLMVAAVERGFAHGSVRDPGDVFMFTGELGTWMMPGDHKNVEEIRAEFERARRESLKPAPVAATGM